MLRGISFKTNLKYDKVIDKIMGNLMTNEYMWFIKKEEIFPKKDYSSNFFTKDLYESDELRKLFQNECYYVFLLNLQAYPFGANISSPNNYSEFLQSDCEIILYCIDGLYFDIYCKNTNTIQTIFLNVSTEDFYDIAYITDENDMLVSYPFWK